MISATRSIGTSRMRQNAKLRRGAAILLAVMLTAASGAQAARPTKAPYALAADDERLWLAEVGPRETRLFQRAVATEFAEHLPPLRGSVVMLAVRGGSALALFDDKSFYEIQADGAVRPELNLPERGAPLDLLAAETGAYALIAAETAAEMPNADPNAAPIDPNDGRLWAARYAQRRWSLVGPTAASAPAELRAALRPRLAWMKGRLWVFWYVPESGTLRYAAFGDEVAAADEGALAAPAPMGFWPLTVNRIPQVVLAQAGADGGVRVGARRALDAPGLRFGDWRSLELTDPNGTPWGARLQRVHGATAFNQHVAALVSDERDQAFLSFAQHDRPPTEPTVALRTALAGDAALPYAAQIQALAFVLLISLVAGVFLLRRESLTTPAQLPPPLALALATQRWIGGLIDLLPFAIFAGLSEETELRAGVEALATWALGIEGRGAGLPSAAVLRWWALSVAMYATYCLIMELLTGRTIGKVLTRTWVTDEGGARPTRGRILLRNVLRVVELLPPLWAMLLLVVLTPKRQRLGDIFARTLLVRRGRYHVHVVDRRESTAADGADDDAPADADEAGDESEARSKQESDKQGR